MCYTSKHKTTTIMKNLMLFTPVLFIAAILVFSSSCKKDDLAEDMNEQNEQTAVEQEKTLRYEIECPNCYVVYYAEDEEQISSPGECTGWFVELDVQTGFVGFLVAQNQSGSPAAVTTTMKLNGEILQTKTTYCPVSGTVFVTDTIQ